MIEECRAQRRRESRKRGFRGGEKGQGYCPPVLARREGGLGKVNSQGGDDLDQCCDGEN